LHIFPLTEENRYKKYEEKYSIKSLHTCIRVKDLEDNHQELANKGYEVTDLTGLSDGVASYFFASDPDGYKIEVVKV